MKAQKNAYRRTSVKIYLFRESSEKDVFSLSVFNTDIHKVQDKLREM